MSLNDLVASYASRGDQRLNYNATVKDEVDNIEVQLWNNLDKHWQFQKSAWFAKKTARWDTVQHKKIRIRIKDKLTLTSQINKRKNKLPNLSI